MIFSEERRLLHIGFPLEDAITLCSSMRRDGELETFIQYQEEIFNNRVKQLEDGRY